MEAQVSSVAYGVVAVSGEGGEMIPTKTYPLSAIMGKEIEKEYERGYAQGCEEGKERIAELEAELMMRREQAEGLQNQWVKDTQKIVALEAEVTAQKIEARIRALEVEK